MRLTGTALMLLVFSTSKGKLRCASPITTMLLQIAFEMSNLICPPCTVLSHSVRSVYLLDHLIPP